MKISTTILSIKDDNQFNNKLKELNETTTDYLHLDIMDGEFVPPVTWNIEDARKIVKIINKPLDIHLMVKDVIKYVDEFKTLNPNVITFHFEAVNNINDVITYIKNNNIKVGISINPDTAIDVLLPYLNKIDLVLVMSVNPGYGCQKFILNSIDKIKSLNDLREKYNYKYLIEVDGGINNDTIKFIKSVDIIAVGSYITKSNNYQERINKLNIS